MRQLEIITCSMHRKLNNRLDIHSGFGVTCCLFVLISLQMTILNEHLNASPCCRIGSTDGFALLYSAAVENY